MKKNMITPYFEDVETIKEYHGYFCSVAEIITIMILGSICGLKNVSQIHQWATSDRVNEFLKEKFGIEQVPCYYWMLCLLKLIKPESLNTWFFQWVSSILSDHPKCLTISFDRKTIRSTGKMKQYKNPLHIVSTQISELGITLAQKSVSGKSNEILVVQELIEELELDGCMVVADALNFQKKNSRKDYPRKGRLFIMCQSKNKTCIMQVLF